MKQEDYNDMMRLPGEQVRQASRLPVCPKCGEAYCGNGESLCVECEHERESSAALEVINGRDPNKALRFARRQDAEMFARDDEDAWHIVEHMWPAVDSARGGEHG